MKNYKLISCTIFIFIAAVFSNCSVTKRSYRPGYYVSWNKKALTQAKVAKIIKPFNEANNNKIDNDQVSSEKREEGKTLVASVERIDNSVLKRNTVKPLALKSDSCGDLITLHNGDDIVGGIVEISPKVIKYKRCDNLEGPTVVVNVEDVFMIRYANGTKEVFKKEDKKSATAINSNVKNEAIAPEQPEYNDFAIASLATAILAFTIILSPIPFILGLVALNQINKEPKKYKGRGMAAVGVVLGGIVLLIILFLLLTLL